MKKLVLSLMLFPVTLYAQKLERYCDLAVVEKMLSSNITITINYGDVTKLLKESAVKDEEVNGSRFESYVDALNYLGAHDWKLVSSVAYLRNGQNAIRFYFKKEYDASDLKAETK